MDNQNVIPIQGTRVAFPSKPYPSQLAMMNKILFSLDRRQNCLIESPTGSGKTLALLCSTIAWQTKFIQNQRLAKVKAEKENYIEPKQSRVVGTCSPLAVTHRQIDLAMLLDSAVANASNNDDDLEDFQPSKKIPIQPFTPSQVNPSVKIDKPCLLLIKNDSGPDQYVFVKEPCIITPKRIIKTNLQSESTLISNEHQTGLAMGDPTTTIGTNETLSSQSTVNMGSSSDELPEMILTTNHKSLKLTQHNHASKISETSPLTTSANRPSIVVEKADFKHDDGKTNTDSFLEESPECESLKQIKYPKIIFGTRTHKQVGQIIRELNKTAYNNMEMCVLGSRDRTCINPIVKSMPSINEGCKEMVEERGCSYYNHANQLTHEAIQYDKRNSPAKAWDLEDLVLVGKKLKSCPYFATRKLMTNAKLIVAPYNYLIDPIIRKSMDFRLNNAIVIFDEAHNIEDAAREAGSLSLSIEDVMEAVKLLDNFHTYQPGYPEIKQIANIFSGLCQFVNSNSDKLNEYREFDSASKVYSGQEIAAVLSTLGLRIDDTIALESFINRITEQKIQDEELAIAFKPINAGIKIMEQLLSVLHLLYKNNMEFISDYKVVITKRDKPTRMDNSGWRRKVPAVTAWMYTINFLCLNSAVTFSEFSKEVHSLIVTSGTLSPLSSFQSELATPFPVQLETNHVVKSSQVWVGTLGKSSKGMQLNAVYRVMETFDFQDEIGKLVIDICKVVPHGILCFFPSYSAMAKLMHRWEETGLLNTLSKYKVVVSEAKRGKREDFDATLAEYYEAIRGGSGGLFFAVCRGKVSEGLDFADDNARAVITIGIPFPNFKDSGVDLKKKYNNTRMSNEKSLMSGNDWYEVQAFRALNQALGRCIRHKGDWGALFIVDERFQTNPRYTTHLSKWVRQNLVHHATQEQAINSLREFNKINLENESQYMSQSQIVEVPDD